MRADLRGILTEVLGGQGLDIAALSVTDLGDGFRLHVPAPVSPLVMLDPFVPNLARAVRLHNKASNDATRLRLRVAAHMGLLHHEVGGGVAGRVLVETARLLDAPAARELISRSGADLVLVVSAEMYDAVIRPGYAMDPDVFQRIRVQVKETDIHAWAHLAGSPRPAPSPPDPPNHQTESHRHDESHRRDGSQRRDEPGRGDETDRHDEPDRRDEPDGRPVAPTGVRLGTASAVIITGDRRPFREG